MSDDISPWPWTQIGGDGCEGSFHGLCDATGAFLAGYDGVPSRANLALILAAPELLEACEAALDYLPRGHIVQHQVRVAVAKARAAPRTSTPKDTLP